MKIAITNEAGETVFSYDTTASTGCVFPGVAAKGEIANVLHDATAFLGSDQHIIASIKADIQTAVTRIEHELGAHPAFTWAQTKLGNAAAHLEAYVKGNWTEPFWPTGTVLDQRGMIVPPPANGVATPAA